MLKSGVLTYPEIPSKRYAKFVTAYVAFYIALMVERLFEKIKVSDDLDSDIQDIYYSELQAALNDIKIGIEGDFILIDDVVKYGLFILNFTKNQLLNALLVSYKAEFLDSFLTTRSTPLLKSWAITNSRLIKSIPLNLLNDFATIVESGYRDGSSIKDIKDKIKVRFKVSEAKATFLAKNEISNLHSDYIKHSCLKLGLSEYGWRTMNDEKVRKSHEVLDNKICSWDNSSVYKNSTTDKKWFKRSSINATLYQVGKDYNCRCSPYIIINN